MGVNMRKILLGIFGGLLAVCANAAQVANLDYVHKLIAQKWDISVPIRADNPMQVANMKYLLTAIDVANEILNGEPTTNYGNGEFATLHAADTIATNQAVETLIKEEIEYEFFLTTTSTNSFSFKISAAGEFIVNWGDGTIETITKPDTTNTTYSHTYSTSKSYTIKLAGQATAYNTGTSTAAISFEASSYRIALIDGSLGAIFGTLADGTQPRFYQTFYYATVMTGSIPENLFAGISGAPATYMFYHTFYYCNRLTGAIPDGLFGNLTGAPASNMFYGTFYNCSGLTGAIPDGLFGNLTGAPAERMFGSTFYNCSGLTGEIPENLFGNISGPAQTSMFYQTFYNCKSLTGPSARINGQYLYKIWPNATSSQVGSMYYRATGLSDYLYIPDVWGGLGATTNEYPSAPSDAVYDFYLTTTSDTDTFAMRITAAGEFYIDWGDGKSEWITKSNTSNMTFGHKYASKGVYNIRLGGQATAYTSLNTGAISFYVDPLPTKIASIDGSLGAIFGTLSSDTNNQPRFTSTFYNATNMTGSIPENLFAGISGAPASHMFDLTFSGCSGLTGAIPDGLFGNLTGAPANSMFSGTFNGCRGLTGEIPENLFGNISGTAQSSMFSRTFSGCSSLTGPSARINGQYLYEIWPDATSSQVGYMYYNVTGLSDYSNIPSAWK